MLCHPPLWATLRYCSEFERQTAMETCSCLAPLPLNPAKSTASLWNWPSYTRNQTKWRQESILSAEVCCKMKPVPLMSTSASLSRDPWLFKASHSLKTEGMKHNVLYSWHAQLLFIK